MTDPGTTIEVRNLLIEVGHDLTYLTRLVQALDLACEGLDAKCAPRLTTICAESALEQVIALTAEEKQAA